MKLYKKFTITRGDNTPYLVRYTIFKLPWLSMKVHNILESDDACLHNHPWAFVSIILKGGYTEVSKELYCDYPGKEYNKVYYGPGSILYRKANWAHRLDLTKPVWTLVFTFKRVQDWGFFTPNGFVNWRHYRQNKEGRCE